MKSHWKHFQEETSDLTFVNFTYDNSNNKNKKNQNMQANKPINKNNTCHWEY